MTTHAPEDTLFLTSEPLYLRRGVYLDLSPVPFNPERLLDIIPVLHRFRLNSVVIHWGELFPWSFEERLQSPCAYHQQVVSGFYRRLKEEDIATYTRIPGPDSFSFILRLKAFAHLRRDRGCVDTLDTEKPGALQLINELIDDTARLCPSTGFFLETEGLNSLAGHADVDAGRRREFYCRVVEAAGSDGRAVLFQLPRGEEAAAYPLEVTETVVSGTGAAGGKGWIFLPADYDTSGLTLAAGGVLLVPPRRPAPCGFPDCGGLFEGLLHILRAATYLWNGRPQQSLPGNRALAASLFPGVENITDALEGFNRSMWDIYNLATYLKTIYGSFRCRADQFDPGGRDTERALARADELSAKGRRCMKDILAVSRSFISPAWMEDWCSLRLMAALEDLESTRLKIRLFLDLRSNRKGGG